jgi:hypothetical protein
VCQICCNRGDEDHLLRYLCACSGSIKFMHQDCLLQWLDHSNTRRCEVKLNHPHPLLCPHSADGDVAGSLLWGLIGPIAW